MKNINKKVDSLSPLNIIRTKRKSGRSTNFLKWNILTNKKGNGSSMSTPKMGSWIFLHSILHSYYKQYKAKKNCCVAAIPSLFFFTNLAPQIFFMFSVYIGLYSRAFGHRQVIQFFSHLILIFLPQFHSMSILNIISCKLTIWVPLS